MAGPSLLECQCGARFEGAWSRTELGELVADRRCPGCSSMGRIFRASVPGFVPPAIVEEVMPVEDVAAVALPMPEEAAPARVESPLAAAASMTRPKPRAHSQPSLAV